MMRSFTTSLLVVVLGGCASSGQAPVLLHEVLKPGVQLVVAKPIKREPVNQAIYFQAGKEHSWWGADIWRTRCQLRVGAGVSNESLAGSVSEVISVRRELRTQGDIGEVPSIYVVLHTISGASVEELRCERWRDYQQHSHTASEITLEDFEDAVNGYLQIVGRQTLPSSKDTEQQ